MHISGFNKTTLLDYPGLVAATIFLKGCNFRCPFCHNKSLVLASETDTISEISPEELFSFLKKRQNILEGVCITGGEPTLNSSLPEFISKIKALGYKVKLDTNGSNPTMLKELINNGLIDYCAMDIKNCLAKYPQTAGISNLNPDYISESVDYLLHTTDFDYEFRTTLVSELHTASDIEEIAKWIKGAKAYYLQTYRESEGVIRKGFHAPTEEALNEYLQICQKYIGKGVSLRD